MISKESVFISGSCPCVPSPPPTSHTPTYAPWLEGLVFPVDSKIKMKWQAHHVLQDNICQEIDGLPDTHTPYGLDNFMNVSEMKMKISLS